MVIMPSAQVLGPERLDRSYLNEPRPIERGRGQEILGPWPQRAAQPGTDRLREPPLRTVG